MKPSIEQPSVKVAAVITTYNSAHLLPACLDSVLAQTYPMTEIIVVDDGSTDNTREVVESYAPPVRYFWRPNGGVSAARNIGVQQSTCPWIATLDADDRWKPEKTARQIDALAGDPLAAFCYAGRTLVHPDGTHVPDPAPPVSALWAHLRCGNPVTPSTMLVRRDLLLGIGGFDEKLRACEDWELACRLIRTSRGVAIEEPLVLYHVGHDSLSHDIDVMLDSISETLEKGPLSGLTGLERWSWRRRGLCAEFWRCALRAREMGRPGQALALILRSLAMWPSPFFLWHRYKSLLVYLLRPSFTDATVRDA